MKGSVCIQAESYKERILEPREEAKKTKKEEEFRKFLGPAWKGKGTALGGVSHKKLTRIMLNLKHESSSCGVEVKPLVL